MTDRLATLMHHEVDSLDIPPAPAPEILGAGRRLRRRRTWTKRGGAAVLAVAVVAVAASALHRNDSTQTAPATTTSHAPERAYAVDDTVYLDDGKTTATMPEVAQSLYYTSAGLLVRTNKDGSSDGGAPFHFELVHADGTTTKLGVTLGEVVPSTDPSEPYLAWATMTDGKIQVVVHDVSTDQDVATVDVPGTFDWGGWEAPPVALSGHLVFVGTNGQAEVVNWQTGVAEPSANLAKSSVPSVAGNHVLAREGGKTLIFEAVSGEQVATLDTGNGFPVLSPDGRFVIVSGGHTDIYDVATGSKVQVPSSGWGWTSSGDAVFRVDDSKMDTCSATTGDCQTTTVPALGKNAFARYAGVTFES
jgi:hypothetical protein